MAVQFEPRQLTPFGSRRLGDGGPPVPVPTWPFMAAPEQKDDAGSVYFYFGWESINGQWLIHRQTRATSQTEVAQLTSNPVYLNLTAAWPDRQSLTYA